MDFDPNAGFGSEKQEDEFMISDLELFCRDIRIRLYDAYMVSLAKENKTNYVPILAGRISDPAYLDKLPKEVETDLESLVSLKEMRLECDMHLKRVDGTYMGTTTSYDKLLNSIHGLLTGRMLHNMTKEGILEMCADNGKIVYRRTPKGMGFYNQIKGSKK
jgi:hypothetical protein